LKGKLIVIEGGECSGKSTQLKLLKKNLESVGREVVTIHFPKHGVSFGKVVDAYLMGDFGDKNKIPPEFISMLYMTDFYEALYDLNKALNEGKIVLLSRYFTSTLCYQVALANDENKEQLWNWIKETCSLLPQPDKVFFISVPLKYVKNMLENENRSEEYKRGKKKDQHESDFEFLAKLEKEYEKNVSRLGWEKVECFEGDNICSIEKFEKIIFDKTKKVLEE
jgi:dTMP kinase